MGEEDGCEFGERSASVVEAGAVGYERDGEEGDEISWALFAEFVVWVCEA